jgi:PAS domain S-box-containing protein
MEKNVILVVDDDDANRYVKKRILSQAGYHVIEAANGGEALHCVATERPHLVCLDINLPDMSGIEVCREIKCNPAMASVLVLQVSAMFVTEEDKIRGLDGGADGYLTMPLKPDGLLATVRALLRLRHAEQALRDSEERYRLAASVSSDAIWDWDISRNSIRWSEAVRSVFHWEEALHGTSIDWWKERIHPDECENVLNSLQAVFQDPAQQEWQGEYRFRIADGAYATVLDRGHVVRDVHGHPIRMFGAILDITERKRAQERLLQWNAELERQVAQRTEELVRSQRRLRALAKELTLAEQRERERLASELHDHLAQLLALGRIKVGHLKNRPPASWGMRFNEIEELFEEALTYVRTLVAELHPPLLHGATLPVALAWLGEHMWRHDLQVEVHIDPTNLHLPDEQAILLFQCVRELLFNVIKHAKTNRATVRQGVQASEMRISVEDKGAGFDPREQAAREEERSKFGLFSIRERMEALGGSLEITSAVAQGTRATLILPYTRAEAVRSVEKEAPIEKEQGPRGLISLLLVEDHTMVREGLRNILMGYADLRVIGEASNGLDAVEMALRLKPDIVVMDIHMPGIDGIEATRRILGTRRETIVIGLTVMTSATMEETMRAAGASALLSKHSAGEELYQAILRTIRNRAER